MAALHKRHDPKPFAARVRSSPAPSGVFRVDHPAPPPPAPDATLLARLVGETGLRGDELAALWRAVGAQRSRPASEREAVRAALGTLVRARPWPLGGRALRLVAVVGPHGAGKTSVAAKLAARSLLEPGRSVTWIAFGGYPPERSARLRRLPGLASAHWRAAYDADELAECVRARRFDDVFVDGLGEAAAAPALRPEALQGRSRHVLLCLPAAASSAECASASRAAAPFAPTSLAVTRLDERATPAALANGPIATGLPVSTLSIGEGVPEDLLSATLEALLDWLVPLRPLGP